MLSTTLRIKRLFKVHQLEMDAAIAFYRIDWCCFHFFWFQISICARCYILLYLWLVLSPLFGTHIFAWSLLRSAMGFNKSAWCYSQPLFRTYLSRVREVNLFTQVRELMWTCRKAMADIRSLHFNWDIVDIQITPNHSAIISDHSCSLHYQLNNSLLTPLIPLPCL